jgi:MerR family transcriptional regulator, light-induced transcriptional regulator
MGPDARHTAIARSFLSALLSGDEVEAEVAVRAARNAGLGIERINEEIIAPALQLVGDLWARGEITVADEHLATEICVRVLVLQDEADRVARGRLDRRALLAAPSGELHVVALRMAANLLRRAGYDALLLGADVPAAALADAAQRHQADVICLSATMTTTDQMLVAIQTVHERRPGAGFVLGGRGLTSRVLGLPGVDVCQRVTDIVVTVDAMVHRPDAN